MESKRVVDLLDQRAQIRLHHAVELDALARGDPQGVVAVSGGQFVEHRPLPGRHHAARDAPPDHHDVFLAGLAQVAVVLLIRAVELQELIVVLGEMVRAGIIQRRGNGAGQRRNGLLDVLVVRPLGRTILFNHK